MSAGMFPLDSEYIYKVVLHNVFDPYLRLRMYNMYIHTHALIHLKESEKWDQKAYDSWGYNNNSRFCFTVSGVYSL